VLLLGSLPAERLILRCLPFEFSQLDLRCGDVRVVDERILVPKRQRRRCASYLSAWEWRELQGPLEASCLASRSRLVLQEIGLRGVGDMYG